jgi:hypothetical protein
MTTEICTAMLRNCCKQIRDRAMAIYCYHFRHLPYFTLSLFRIRMGMKLQFHVSLCVHCGFTTFVCRTWKSVSRKFMSPTIQGTVQCDIFSKCSSLFFNVMLEDKSKFQNIDRLLRKRHIRVTTVTMVIQERVLLSLGFTEPLTGMSTRKLPGGKARLASKADRLTAICKPIF